MPNEARPDASGAALTYASGTAIASHAHPAHQLIHAVSGAMRVVASGSLWFLPLGRALWIPAGVAHAIGCDGEVGMRTAYLSRACGGVPDNVCMIAVSPLLREALVRLAEDQDGRLRPLLREVLIHELARGAAAPFRLPFPDDPRLARLVASLHADPADRRSMADWARQLGLSERSLIRAVRGETGMTFRELRRHARVMVAIERLAEGKAITTVAYDVGFETPNAFSQAFRVVTGKTPRQFVGEGRSASRS